MTELKESVKHQEALVTVTREATHAELEAIREERDRQRRAAQPKFVLDGFGQAMHGPSQLTFSADLVNAGSGVTDLRVIASLGDLDLEQRHIAAMGRGERKKLQFTVPNVNSQPWPMKVVLTYAASDESPGRAEFSINWDAGTTTLSSTVDARPFR